MEGLVLTCGFKTIGAPSRIEFTLGNAVSRSEAHKCGASKSAGKAETEEDKQAAQPETKQSCGFCGVDQFKSKGSVHAKNNLASCLHPAR